jgi:glucosamine--fructose-6-phosphate aminotransferase (isomerizing)
MCGIVAYLGEKEAQPLLLEGLYRLEYRGYDSSGLAVVNGSGLRVVKKVGRIQALEALLADNPCHGHLGISHTRWATHGEPSDCNAHPHQDQSGKLALVHNGVVENYHTLKTRLEALGHTFVSETDTEVLAHLVGHHFDTQGPVKGNRLETALKSALREVTGTYGVAVIHADQPDGFVGARRGSPLVLGIGEKQLFLTSDALAVAAHAQKVVYLNDGDVVTVDASGFKISSMTKAQAGYEISDIDQQEADAGRGNFPHYMLKEIFEQPQAIRNAFRGRLYDEESTAKLGGLNLSPAELRDIDRIIILGCGTALHAGMVGEYLIETLAQIPVECDHASEFRYRNSPTPRRTLFFAVSQSGETADTLGALREAQRRGFKVLGICNRVGSSIARESDGGVYLHSGPEIGVAATKSFTAQVMIFALLALNLGRMRYLSATQGKQMIAAIEALPDQITKILQQSDAIKKIAEKYAQKQSMLFFGRQFQMPVALEGALKMKEITYIHAEGYPSAELKHGIIALIDEKTPSLFICPQDSVYDKNLNSIQEVKARKGAVIAIATEGDEEIKRVADDVIYVPAASEYVLPILSVIPLQLLSYHAAVVLNRDVDKPRNLAKSVTVE